MPESINPTPPQSEMGVCVLYAEDVANDIFFFKRALGLVGSPCTLKAMPDGQQAIDYLADKGDVADRLKYPPHSIGYQHAQKSGLEVLQWIRQQPDFKSSPVLIFTSSTEPKNHIGRNNEPRSVRNC